MGIPEPSCGSITVCSRVSIVYIDPFNPSHTSLKQIVPFLMRHQDSKPPRECIERTVKIYIKPKSWRTPAMIAEWICETLIVRPHTCTASLLAPTPTNQSTSVIFRVNTNDPNLTFSCTARRASKLHRKRLIHQNLNPRINPITLSGSTFFPNKPSLPIHICTIHLSTEHQRWRSSGTVAR